MREIKPKEVDLKEKVIALSRKGKYLVMIKDGDIYAFYAHERWASLFPTSSSSQSGCDLIYTRNWTPSNEKIYVFDTRKEPVEMLEKGVCINTKLLKLEQIEDVHKEISSLLNDKKIIGCQYRGDFSKRLVGSNERCYDKRGKLGQSYTSKNDYDSFVELDSIQEALEWLNT